MSVLPPQTPSSIGTWRRFLLLQVAFFLVCLVVGLLAGGDAGALLGVFAWFAVFAYLLPFFIAYSRKHASKWAVGALNLFLGWTLLGWVGSLVWSLAHNQTVG